MVRGEDPWREGQHWDVSTAENKKTGVLSHLGIKVEAQPLCCHVGPSLLCAVAQDAAERKVQQVSSGVVRHAGQALGLKAQSWQEVLVLHSSGEQGIA